MPEASPAPASEQKASAAPTGASSSGGPNGPFPAELGHWSWAAFLMSWLWGIAHSVWISLLCFVPGIGVFIPFVLGAKGNEWAWQNRKFDSVEQFNAVQKAWTTWGVIFFILGIVLSIAAIVGVVILGIGAAATSTTTY